MSKLSVVIFAAALLVGMCSTRSGAYAQNDEEAPPPTTAEQPQAPDEAQKAQRKIQMRTPLRAPRPLPTRARPLRCRRRKIPNSSPEGVGLRPRAFFRGIDGAAKRAWAATAPAFYPARCGHLL